jgi:hypothetical protein
MYFVVFLIYLMKSYGLNITKVQVKQKKNYSCPLSSIGLESTWLCRTMYMGGVIRYAHRQLNPSHFPTPFLAIKKVKKSCHELFEKFPGMIRSFVVVDGEHILVENTLSYPQII